MLTKKLCKDSARSVQDKTKVCFCFYCRAAAYLSLLMFRIQPALVKSKTSVDNYKHSQYIIVAEAQGRSQYVSICALAQIE